MEGVLFLSESSQIWSFETSFAEMFDMNLCAVTDEIDELLAKHYGFTEEELDFIINYDIKYRMGEELNAEE